MSSSIVLAEPSAPVAGVLRRFLESAGHEVSWVGGADEALRIVREQSSAVLMASAMGALDGEALCRRVRAEGLAAPVLLLYSPDEERADTRAAEVGADGCLVGPLKRATVLTCVSLLAQREDARRRVAALGALPPPLPVPPPPPPADDEAAADGPPREGEAVAAQPLAPELDAEPITSPSSAADSEARDAAGGAVAVDAEQGTSEEDGLPLLYADPEPDEPQVSQGEGGAALEASAAAQGEGGAGLEASAVAQGEGGAGLEASAAAQGAEAAPSLAIAAPGGAAEAQPVAPVAMDTGLAGGVPPSSSSEGSRLSGAFPAVGARPSGAFPALASTPVPEARRGSRSDLPSVGSHPDFEFLKRLMLMEVKRSRRYRYPIAVLLVDIDRFAEKAAALPPAARKLALAEALGLLVSGVRDIDVAVPFADSRFVVFLPHTPRSGALVVGQRLRELIKSLKAFEGASASVGVAVSEPPAGRGPVTGTFAQVSFGGLLKDAGEALRRAQAAGGDWVEAASGRAQPG